MGARMDADPYVRFAVRMQARLFALDLPVPIDCVICNLSEHGAQLTVEQPVKLPKRVYLAVDKGGRVLECDVRWRKFNRLFGIRFSSNSNVEARRALVVRACAV
jgi:N-glycosylase/DNA lyase